MPNYIEKSTKKFWAFNVWDINSAKEIMKAAADVGVPVIIQTSMSAYKRIEASAFSAYLKSYAEKHHVEAYLHLDHCTEMEMLQDAIVSGWDSVMIDASQKPLSENIRLTQKACEIAHNRGVAVEGEIGQIEGCEDDMDVQERGIAKMEDIEEYVSHTNVDFLAAAIGNAHGRYKGTPNIHYDLIEKIGELTAKPFVIHGGSGLGDETFIRLLTCPNVKKINISTEVKEAYLRGIETFVKSEEAVYEGFNPLKADEIIYKEIRKMAIDKMKLLP